MANIRVTCPACKSDLEIDEEFEGKEVECGNCLEVFKAEKPSKSGNTVIVVTVPVDKAPASRRKRRDDDDDDRPRRRRRRRDEDDDDDDYAPPPPRPASAPGDGLALTSLILGIVAFPLLCCWPLSIPLGLAATVTGSVGMKSRNNKPLAIVGLVLGLIVLCVAGSIFFAGFGPFLFGGGFR